MLELKSFRIIESIFHLLFEIFKNFINKCKIISNYVSIFIILILILSYTSKNLPLLIKDHLMLIYFISFGLIILFYFFIPLPYFFCSSIKKQKSNFKKLLEINKSNEFKDLFISSVYHFLYRIYNIILLISPYCLLIAIWIFSTLTICFFYFVLFYRDITKEYWIYIFFSFPPIISLFWPTKWSNNIAIYLCSIFYRNKLIYKLQIQSYKSIVYLLFSRLGLQCFWSVVYIITFSVLSYLNFQMKLTYTVPYQAMVEGMVLSFFIITLFTKSYSYREFYYRLKSNIKNLFYSPYTNSFTTIIKERFNFILFPLFNLNFLYLFSSLFLLLVLLFKNFDNIIFILSFIISYISIYFISNKKFISKGECILYYNNTLNPYIKSFFKVVLFILGLELTLQFQIHFYGLKSLENMENEFFNLGLNPVGWIFLNTMIFTFLLYSIFTNIFKYIDKYYISSYIIILVILFILFILFPKFLYFNDLFFKFKETYFIKYIYYDLLSKFIN